MIQFLTLDPENPSSILSCLRRARENARSIREAISADTWEQVNRFYLMVSSRERAAADQGEPRRVLRRREAL